MTDAATAPARVDFDSAGQTIAAYRWDPAEAPRAVAQITHGMGEHALRYADLAAALNDRGYVVYAQDHRGHGASTDLEHRGEVGAEGWAELVEDIGRLTAVARDAHPGLPLVLVAHSMGSFAAQQYILDHSADLDALVLTGTAAIDLLEAAIDLDGPMDLSAFNAPFTPARTDYDWLSRDPEQVDRYVADDFCGFGLDAESGRAMFAGARRVADPEQQARVRSDLPVYIAVGEHDPVNAGLQVVQPYVDRLAAAGLTDVTFVTYPEARHEIFNETNRAEVVTDLLAWLDQKIPA